MVQTIEMLSDARIYNLRKELARQLWAARSGNIDVFEASENTRDLVALCPEKIIDSADKLQHAVMNQITMKVGQMIMMKKWGKKIDVKVKRIASRGIWADFKFGEGFIG